MPTLLIVEDDDINRMLIARLLAAHGYQTLTAADGAEAITRATDDLPDLIVMDLGLPVIDGWEAIARLKSTDTTAGIPIVVLSGYVLAHDEQRAYEAGCDAFETKPINLASFLGTIRRLLDERPG